MRFSYIQNVLQMAPLKRSPGDEGVRLYLDEDDPINGNELVFTNQNPMLFMVTLLFLQKKQSLMDPMYISTQTGLIKQ
jgi:hypothetical protein